jgi:transposase
LCCGFYLGTENEAHEICTFDHVDKRRATELLRWSRGRSTPARQVLRAGIVLLAAEGRINREIAEQLRTAKKTVSLWRTRFADRHLAGIERDAPRSGRKPAIRQATVRTILAKTTQETPAGATHWSTRTMAKALGISHATVARVEGQRTEAAFGAYVQSLERSPLRGETGRRGWAVLGSSRARNRVVRGRKESDPGARSHAEEPAFVPGLAPHSEKTYDFSEHEICVRGRPIVEL